MYNRRVVLVGVGCVMAILHGAQGAAPSADEQLWLEMINRFRGDPVSELDLLANYTVPGGNTFASPASDDSLVALSLNHFNVDAATLRSQFNALTPAPPLAWNVALDDSATHYSGLMAEANRQSHSLDNFNNRDRITAYSDYEFTGGGPAAENIFAFVNNSFHGHAGLVIDWGGNIATGGIQNPPAHRNILLNPVYREIGIGIVPENDPQTQVGPLVVTQHLATDRADGPYLTGVAYHDDVVNDDFYSIGEGLGGLLVEVFETGTSNRIATTTTWASGGYSVEVPLGVYDVKFSGQGSVVELAVGVDVTSGDNVKVDAFNFGTVLPPIMGDANGDRKVDSEDLNILAVTWQQAVAASTEADFSGDGIINAVDLNLLTLNWQFGADQPSLISLDTAFAEALASSVPEPGTLTLLAVTFVGLAMRRRSNRGSA